MIWMISRKRLLKSMDARYKEKEGKVPDNLAEGFMQMEKLIKEQPEIDPWISCKKQLPNDSFEELKWDWGYVDSESGVGCSVLVTIDNYPDTPQSNPHVKETVFYKGYNDFNEDDVIAWMPMPKPYVKK